MKIEKFFEKSNEIIFALTIFFAFSGLYASAKGHSYLSILVVSSIISGLLTTFITRKWNVFTSEKVYCAAAFAIYGVALVFNRLLHGDDSAMLRITLCMVCFALFIPQTDFVKRFAMYGVIVGGFTIGGITYVELMKGVARVGGYTNEILFAQGALILFLLNVYSILKNKKIISIQCLSGISAISSLYGLYFSQSRGVWLSLIIITILYALIKINSLGVKKAKSIAISIFAAFGLIYTFIAYDSASNIFVKRVDDVRSDFYQMASGNYQTSIGLRFVVWKSAWLGFLDHPFIGVGNDGIDELKKQQVIEKKVNPILLVGDGGLGMSHAHNQYLNQLVMRGCLGFIPMMLLFMTPFLFKEKFGKIGVFVTVAYMIFGLTDVPLEQKETLYMFLFALVFSIVQTNANEQKMAS